MGIPARAATAVRVLVLIGVASWSGSDRGPGSVCGRILPIWRSRLSNSSPRSRRIYSFPRGGADPALSPRPGNLAQPVDDSRNPMYILFNVIAGHDGPAGRASPRGAEFRRQALLWCGG